MKITYTFNNEKVPSKLNPQQTALVNSLKDAGTVEKDDILKLIEEKGLLVTKQDPWLIFKYYQPGFIKSGFVELNKQLKPKAERVSKRNIKEIVVRDQSGFPIGDDTSDETELVPTIEESEKSGW